MSLTIIPFDLPGKLFRSAMPFSSYDRNGDLIYDYRENKIDRVVLLTSSNECKMRTGIDLPHHYREEGFKLTQVPIEDFNAATKAELEKLVAEIVTELNAGQNIVVHCFMGLGRAGMVLATVVRHVLSLEAVEAVAWLRNHVPGAVQSHQQLEMIARYQLPTK